MFYHRKNCFFLFVSCVFVLREMPRSLQYSDSLKEPIHHQLTEPRRKTCKVSRKARDTHHKIGVQIGVLMCFEQLFAVQNVDIDQRTALLEVTENASRPFPKDPYDR